MKCATRILICLVSVWICSASPLSNSDVTLDCQVAHSEGVTWDEHCNFLNRDCTPPTETESARCGDCKAGHVEDKINKEKCVDSTKLCKSTHTTKFGTWEEHCASLKRQCSEPGDPINEDPKCGDCITDDYVTDHGDTERCVSKNSCDGTQAKHVTWKEFCDANHKECVPNTGTDPAKCGECFKDYETDKIDTAKCVAKNSCEGSNPDSTSMSWKQFCDSVNRFCISSTEETEAKCGDCISDHQPDKIDSTKCIATVYCTGDHGGGVTWQEHCNFLNRECIPAPVSSKTSDACGGCKEGHEFDKVFAEKCVKVNSCEGTHDSGVLTWKEHCQMLNRKCKLSTATTPAACEDCLDGYQEDEVNKGICIAKNSCDGTHSESLLPWSQYCDSVNKACKPSTETEEAKCGACLSGYEEDKNQPETCTAMKCVELTAPENGKVDIGCDTTTHGGTCKMSCNENYYHSEGNLLRTCGPNGQWDGKEPLCGKYCEKLVAPDYTTVVYGCKAQSKLDENCTMECYKGTTHMTGDLVRTCQEDGTWTGNPPICSLDGLQPTSPDDSMSTSSDDSLSTSADDSQTTTAETATTTTPASPKTCEMPKDPENGFTDFGCEVKPGSVCEFGCNDTFYHAKGNLSRTCEGGKWTGDDPLCGKQCKKLSKPDNTKVESGCEDEESKLDDKCVVSCTSGTSHKSGDLTRACSLVGKWTGEPPVCSGMMTLLGSLFLVMLLATASIFNKE